MSQSTHMRQTWLERVSAKLAEHERRLVMMGMAAAALMALISQLPHAQAQKGALLNELSLHEDLHNLYYAAASATWKQSFSWWVGPWNYPGAGYYRPLTSVLFLAEYRIFGNDFASYNRVTCGLHSLNAALLFLLVTSLLHGAGPIRVLCGLIAVYFFATPSSSMIFAVERALDWWPAQNDPLSLVFGLLSLILLDRYLTRPSRFGLALPLFAFYLSVASKEMGYIVAPIAAALVWWRRGRLNREAGWYVGLAFALYLLRLVFVPNPWSPSFQWRWTVQKALTLWLGDHALRLEAGDYWLVLSALAVSCIFLGGLKRNWSIYAMLIGSLGAVAAIAQTLTVTGNFAMILDPLMFKVLIRLITYQLCVFLFIRYRRSEPGLFAAAAFALSFIPILGYSGTYYYYWPGAFLGIADGIFTACLVRWAYEIWPEINWSWPQIISNTWDRAFRWTREKETQSAEMKR